MAGVTATKFIFGKFKIIGGEGSLDDGVIGLIGLDNDVGGVKMAPADAADDLREELKTTFFGSKIGQGESRVGLNHANGGKMRQVEPPRQSLGANENIDFAGLDGLIKLGETAGFFIITIKSGDFSLRKETDEFGFKQFSAKTFVHNAGMMTIWAARGDFGFVPTEVTSEFISIRVEIHGDVAIRAERLPTAIFANGHWRRTTTIMKNQSLMISLEIIFDFCQKLVGKIAILMKIITITEVNDGNFWLDSGGFGLSREFNESMMGLSEVKIDNVGRGGTINTGNFTLVGHKTGKT